MSVKPRIGFIGQGFIGRNYADDFEARSFEVVRYALEEPYRANRGRIAHCDIVFIAVPTPTTPEGFSTAILEELLPLVGSGKIAVIKSTILPGTTERLQKLRSDIYLFHSPEFLTEATAAHDAAKPNRNIIGMPVWDAAHEEKAQLVMSVLPRAPFQRIMPSRAAELIKYGGNCWFYLKIVYMNMLYDLSQKLGIDYHTVREGMAADPRVGKSHLMPVHASGTIGSDDYEKRGNAPDARAQGGRGAGGHCFIKDFAAFKALYEELVDDPAGLETLHAIEQKNIGLLVESGKDLDLVAGVYGKERTRPQAASS